MLMYHSVIPTERVPAWPWAVSLQRFREQLDFLVDAGWSTPTMRELTHEPERLTQRSVVITFDDGYIDNLAACEELQRRSMRATWFMVSGSLGVEPAWPADGRPSGRLLNAMELREMQSAGMEIGSHTVSHARLTQIDDSHLRSELVESKHALENILGAEVGSFAYPYGAWDARCEAAVQVAGYARACTTRTGWSLTDNNTYRLRRLTVFNSDTPSSLARKLVFASHDVSWPSLAGYLKRQLMARLGA
jgi:peptidoglycan/xylan/chitin deacetylase (PgdA/CDA1 family)